jgi:hypothetical protein
MLYPILTLLLRIISILYTITWQDQTSGLASFWTSEENHLCNESHKPNRYRHGWVVLTDVSPLNNKTDLFSVLVSFLLFIIPVSHNLKFTNAPHTTANNKAFKRPSLPPRSTSGVVLRFSFSLLFTVGLSPISAHLFSITRMMLNP